MSNIAAARRLIPLRAGCRRQTSVSAGTVMHGSHLPLRTWFMAAHIVASHSNGISALQVQAQLGIGSYKAAWLLLHKLRRAMVDPDRSLLQEIVEADETEMPFRARQTRSSALRKHRISIEKSGSSGLSSSPRTVIPGASGRNRSPTGRRRPCMASLAGGSSRAPTSSPTA